jgi:hypothetical protein
MSKGKIVLSGAEPEAVTFMGVRTDECPVINIRPLVDDVYNKLLAVYENRSAIPDISSQGIDFVARHHAPLPIATRYMELYKAL